MTSAILIITLVTAASPRIPVIQIIDFASMSKCVAAKEVILQDYEQDLSRRSYYSVVCVSNN